MKIYLASRYSRHPEMREYAVVLSTLGHQITSRWILGDHDVDDNAPPEVREAARVQFAKEDLEDLIAADCVISFTEEPGKQTGRGRGGRHVEFGYALATSKRTIIVGFRENVFHGLPQVEFFPTWVGAFIALQQESRT